jgi:hypothetical protein
MKAFRCLYTVLLAILLVGFAGPSMAADQIHFTLVSPTAVTFDWEGTGDHTIHYGTSPGSYAHSVVASAASPAPWSDPGPYWQAKLTGLNANTKYYYKIDTGTEHSFTTMPEPGTASTFSVVVQSDGGDHLHYSTFVPTENLIAAQKPDLVLYVGDTSHNNRDSNSYLGRIAHFQDVQVWSQDAPYMMIYGNHDWDKPSYDDLRNYKGRFDFPNPQTSPGSPTAGGEDWYWFDYGSVRFIAYPEPWTSATWTDWKTKATTLMDQAQADSKIDFIVTYGHRPAYSSGHHPGSSTIKDILDTLGADHSKYVLNFNGHSHVYERTYPQSGVIHVTDASPAVLEAESGSCKYYGGCPAPSWSEYRAYHLGFVKLEFSPDGIQGSFICGPSSSDDDVTCAQGSVLDTWIIDNPTPPPATDTTPPRVGVSYPTSGAQLAGTVTLTANASDNVGVTMTEFYVDGVLLDSATQSGTDWKYTWNTKTVSDSTHTVTARAYDAAGNSTLSLAVTFTVKQTASDAGFIPLITDPYTVYAVPAADKPGYLSPVILPPFDTEITRIADDPGQSMLNISGTWGTDARHHYSKDQPWNSNGTLIALQNNASPSTLFLDGETYEPKYGKCSNYPSGDDRWHPSTLHPNERIIANATSLSWFDVAGCTKTRSWTLPISVNNFGPSEGNPSQDGRFALLADATRMFVVDMDPQPPYASYPATRIGPVTDFSDCGLSSCTLDWVSISPSGKYAVVSYSGDYVRVYDINPNTLALTPRPMATIYPGCHGTAARGFIYDVGHADMALNPFDNNEDVIVGQEHCGNSGETISGKLIGGVMMVRLKDGAITPLTDPTNEAYPHHVSTRNLDRSGWAYVGYYPEDGARFNDEIIAVKLDGSGDVQRFAQKRSIYSGCYRCESHAVPSRDGRRVLFASNWDDSSGPIQAYIVDARSDSIPVDTTSPNVALTFPASGAAVSGTVTLSATASDNVAVTKVEFYHGTTLIGTGTNSSGSTWQRSWNTASIANGSYALTAKAYDAAGNSKTSSAVTVTVSNTDATPPTVSLTSPASGAAVSGTVTLSATASDNVAVTKVEFYHGTTLIGTGTNSSGSTWQRSWNTASIANGSYALTAKAYDVAGNSKTSSAVTVTVSNTDTTPPTVSLTSPASGDTLSGTVTLSATASDNVAVTKVEFYYGTTLIGTGTNSSGSTWQRSWNTSTVADGSYALTARAYDAAGNSRASSSSTVSVSNSPSSDTKSITFKATADGYVRSSSPSSSYGTKNVLYVENDSGIRYSAYIKFAASGITGKVQSAKLRVYATRGTDNGPAVYKTTNNWTESKLTASTAPAAVGSALDDKGSISNGTWVVYDVTDVVTGDGTYSFVLPPSSAKSLTLSSREGSYPPRLVVTFAR